MGTLTADQITFIGQIIDHRAQNGIMDPAALFEPPFTDFHDEDVSGVLPEFASDMVNTIEQIKANALAS